MDEGAIATGYSLGTEEQARMTITTEAVVATLTRYLRLCDEPSPERTRAKLGSLFTDDAVWEGLGPEYAQRFGRTQGRAQIVTMLFGYAPQTDKLTHNVHLLFPGEVDVSDDTARGAWAMQQLSSYASGRGELMVARLEVEFRSVGRKTLISQFATRRLFQTELSS
jgi:hypothetical protein